MFENIHIPFQDGLNIEGDLHINKKSKCIIILCHGYQDSKDEPVIKKISEELQCKFNVFRFNFTDKDSPFLPVEKQNILAVVRYFNNKYEEIILLGASLGGLSVLLSASGGLKINKIIFVNPFVYYFKKVAWQFRKILVSMLLLYPFVKSIRKNLNFYFSNLKPSLITVPTLLIVASNDKKVDSIHGKTLYDELGSKQKKLILDDDIDHGLNKDVYIKNVTNYIINWLK